MVPVTHPIQIQKYYHHHDHHHQYCLSGPGSCNLLFFLFFRGSHSQLDTGFYVFLFRGPVLALAARHKLCKLSMKILISIKNNTQARLLGFTPVFSCFGTHRLIQQKCYWISIHADNWLWWPVQHTSLLLSWLWLDFWPGEILKQACCNLGKFANGLFQFTKILVCHAQQKGCLAPIHWKIKLQCRWQVNRRAGKHQDLYPSKQG